MKRSFRALVPRLVVSTLLLAISLSLSGCLVRPWGHRHHHHHRW